MNDEQKRIDEILLSQCAEDSNEYDEDDEEFPMSTTSSEGTTSDEDADINSSDIISSDSDNDNDEDKNNSNDTHHNTKKTKRRKKSNKHDKDYIKKPMNSYMFYVNSVRADILREFPNEKTTQIMKIISERWK